jgi:hypothetical protein
MAKTCEKCGQRDHHDPNCPEMFWPDGHKRGVPRPPPKPKREIEV